QCSPKEQRSTRSSPFEYNSERHLLASTPESLTLPHNAKGITLELTTLDYLKARQVQFSYRLSPRETWHALPRGENAIRLTSIPSRRLRLEVKATVPGRSLTRASERVPAPSPRLGGAAPLGREV
ncbi:MAG: hypothetical protein LUB62_01515, partial [Prevotellaceae bacterium]|nr:hypothetical protein [Prevotellaceae bacterium]